MCFGPSTLGAGAKTRLESRIKKFTPHCIYRPSGYLPNYNTTITSEASFEVGNTLHIRMACKQYLDSIRPRL